MYIDGIEYCNVCGNQITDDGCPACDGELSEGELDSLLLEDTDDLRELDFNDSLALPEWEPDFDPETREY